MNFDENINAYFVKTTSEDNENDENIIAKDMQRALECLRKQLPEQHIRQLKSSEGFPLIASGTLTKKDVFVFDRFEDGFFEQLQQTKSLIIGARCLIRCLETDTPIPQGNSPVYTIAMRDLKISASGISSIEKEQIRKLIHWMGGHYYQNFGRGITHLVSNTIKSTKYEHASLNGIPVMHVDWVKRVWERSCVADVNATDKEFEKFSLPIFFGLNITCTGLDTDKKNEVMRLVNENGGIYHRAFRSQMVDVVITEKNCTNSDKYQAAVRYKKDILVPEWIFNSIERGFALPINDYRVKALKVSTPTKNDQSIADFTTTGSTDISRISVLNTKRGGNETVNDTIVSNAVETMSSGPSSSVQRNLIQKVGAGERYRLVYDEICQNQAKKAGIFLDGCSIYLNGFRNEEREKLNRILNAGGATRYDVINEEVTHIIVGQLNDMEFRTWQRNGLLSTINVVRLDWLLESIKLKQPASENIYRVSLPNPNREPDVPSPSSKRTLRSMNHSFKQPAKPIKKKLFEVNAAENAEQNTMITPLASSTELPAPEEENHLIAQYSQENHAVVALPAAPVPPIPPAKKPTNNNDSTMLQPVATSTQLKAQQSIGILATNASAISNYEAASVIDYDNLNFFEGMTLYVEKQHFPEEFYTNMVAECEAAHGNVVTETFRDSVDFAIVSFERTLDATKIPVNARNIVTELYVEICLKENRLMPLEYYHKHIPHTADIQPLKSMIIVISLYTDLERDFIDSLAQLLGANVNKSYVKKERALLICRSAEGSKYEGAIKWRYPVVNSEYLVQCALLGQKLSYRPFLVGNSPEDFPIPAVTSDMLENVPPANSDFTPLRNRRVSELAGRADNLGISSAADSPHNSGMPVAANEKTENDIDMLENIPPVAYAGTTDFTPLRNRRVSELAGRADNLGISNVADSPHTPTNDMANAPYNYDLMLQIVADITDPVERDCIRDLIAEMRNNQTPELERIRRQAYTPINRKLPTPKGIPEFCTTPEFEQRMVDEFDRRWRLPTKKLKPDTPIDEIRRRFIIDTCRSLGIPINNENESITNMQDAEDDTAASTTTNTTTNDATPVLHKSNVSGVSCMEPRSIFSHKSKQQPACNTTLVTEAEMSATAAKGTRRESDTYVPDTQSPGNSSNNSMLLKHASLGKSTINFDKISFEETEMSVENRPSTSRTLEKASPEMLKITEYLKNKSARLENIKRSNEDQGSDFGLSETEAAYVGAFESERQIGMEDVAWHDPQAFNSKRFSTLPLPSMQYEGTPCFSISCADEKLRDETIRKILELGGKVSENMLNFDMACTHFLCVRPNRGEKMMGCIASGKWVLSITYIEECYHKKLFLSEENFEWGNDIAFNLPELKDDEENIAKAAVKWRMKLSQEKDKGAFDGILAILRISERQFAALKNVVKAGGGDVIEAKSPYNAHNNAHKATHCFVDVKKMPLTKTDYNFLQRNGCLITTQMYINAYLMNGSDVDVEKYRIKM